MSNPLLEVSQCILILIISPVARHRQYVVLHRTSRRFDFPVSVVRASETNAGPGDVTEGAVGQQRQTHTTLAPSDRPDEYRLQKEGGKCQSTWRNRLHADSLLVQCTTLTLNISTPPPFHNLSPYNCRTFRLDGYLTTLSFPEVT